METTDPNRARRGWFMRASLALFIVAGWLALAPPALGGQVAFVAVDGTSMEPDLRTGDLVVVRRQATYDVGDVVAFEAEGGLVIHRLHSGSMETGFRAKGDNKDAPDPWTIRADDIAGAELLVLRGAGPAVSILSSPLATGGAIALLVFYLVATSSKSERKRPSSNRKAQLMRMRSEAIASVTNHGPAWRPCVPRSAEAPILSLATVASFAAAAVIMAAVMPQRYVSMAVLPLAVPVLIVAAAASALLSARQAWAWGGSPVDKAYATLRTQLVAVSAMPFPEGTVIPIQDPQALLKVAELEQTPVLHLVTETTHRFVVIGFAAVFEHAVTSNGGTTQEPDGREDNADESVVDLRQGGDEPQPALWSVDA